MGKKIPDAVMDAALDNIADNGDVLHVCSAEPANYAAVAGVSLANVSLTPGDGNGDYTIGDGDVSGRKLNVAQQSMTGSATGTGTHVVIVDTTNSLIKAITTCPNYSISNGVGFTLLTFDAWEIQDPT
jgi:hypothetical protein